MVFWSGNWHGRLQVEKWQKFIFSVLFPLPEKISWQSVIRSDQSIMLERWSLCQKCRQMWKIIQEKQIQSWTMDHLDGDLILIRWKRRTTFPIMRERQREVTWLWHAEVFMNYGVMDRQWRTWTGWRKQEKWIQYPEFPCQQKRESAWHSINLSVIRPVLTWRKRSWKLLCRTSLRLQRAKAMRSSKNSRRVICRISGRQQM